MITIRNQYLIAVFWDGGFGAIFEKNDVHEALGFVDAVVEMAHRGAMCGAAAAYILPEHEANMRLFERPEEVIKAMARAAKMAQQAKAHIDERRKRPHIETVRGRVNMMGYLVNRLQRGEQLEAHSVDTLAACVDDVEALLLGDYATPSEIAAALAKIVNGRAIPITPDGHPVSLWGRNLADALNKEGIEAEHTDRHGLCASSSIGVLCIVFGDDGMVELRPVGHG